MDDQNLEHATERVIQAWDELSPELKTAIEKTSGYTGFSIQGNGADTKSGLVVPPTGLTLPDGIVVPEDVQARIQMREQLERRHFAEQLVRNSLPVEPVIIAGAPKPSRTASLSERSRSLRNTARGQKLNRKQSRKEAKKRYG